MDFGRLVTAMVTPFDHNLQVDWQKAETLIDYLIEEQQADSLIISGTTGESPTLTEKEKLGLFELAVRKANGRCKIIAGTGDNNTAYSVELTKKAEALGVDGFLLVTPYYNRPSQEGIYEHFKTIAESTKLPIMLYNIPKRTGVTVSAETTARLSQIPNIVATKESHADFDLITTILRDAKPGFKVYSGDDSLTLPMLSIGGYGVVSVAGHLVGKQMSEMIQAFLDGNVQQASELHHKLHPIFTGIFAAPNPVLVKVALGQRGIDVGGVRPPLAKATTEEEQFITNLLK